MLKHTLASQSLKSQLFKRSFYLILVFVILSTACRRESLEAYEVYDDEQIGEEAVKAYDGQLLARVSNDSIINIVDNRELLQPFIREFGNGTVVDKVTINKVQEDKDDVPAYYLVGLGMQNGAFRSMAIELDFISGQNLYLSSKSAKHICEAGMDCGFCYFTFSGNRITGCACSDRGTGNSCVHKFSPNNQMLKTAKATSRR